jgi:hypothetical protein
MARKGVLFLVAAVIITGLSLLLDWSSFTAASSPCSDAAATQAWLRAARGAVLAAQAAIRARLPHSEAVLRSGRTLQFDSDTGRRLFKVREPACSKMRASQRAALGYAARPAQDRLIRKAMRGEALTIATLGTSITASHDNFFNESYSAVFARAVAPALAALRVPLQVRNVGMGNNPVSGRVRR